MARRAQTLPATKSGTKAVSPRGTFPLRVGGIDIGSNAIRLLIAEFHEPAQYAPLLSQRSPVRLGHDVFLTGRLTEPAMNAALAALEEFRSLLERCKVQHCRAVATSAVRESHNGDAFIERVQSETGLAVEIIPGAEEARLVHLAIGHRIPLGCSQWVTVDVGGGSVEVSLVDEKGILWSQSHTMGSVRLLEELSGAAEEPGRFKRLLTEYISTLRLPLSPGRRPASGLIATGGNIESLVKLTGGSDDSSGVGVIPLSSLSETIETLTRLSFRQRVEQLGLRDDRADVILPAAMVYEKLAALAGVDELLVPYVGLRDGAVLDLVDQLLSPINHEARREQQILSGALTLGRRFMFDESHALQVKDLALSLFDQLKPVHELGGEDRGILSAAALLHDIGVFISFKRHHKHSHYLITNSEIPGLSSRAMRLAALVARYHRKSEPTPRHLEFAALVPPEQLRVQRLVALLRLADALDREHLQNVRRVRADVKGNTLYIDLDGRGDLVLERWSLTNKAQYFGKLFHLSIAVNGERRRDEPSKTGDTRKTDRCRRA